MIRTKNLKKSYKSIQVLKGVDLNIAESEIVSIVGASGAGKTTLLQILGTLDAPSNDNCQLLIDNTDILKLDQNELSKFRNTNIGFIFQFYQLLPEFTALENIAIPRMIAGEKLKNITPRAFSNKD